jgi:hypothetical protein
MNTTCCEGCGKATAELGDVVTSEELLAALEERASQDDFDLDVDDHPGECFVYLLRCEPCGWQELRSTERIWLQEDPEPIV